MNDLSKLYSLSHKTSLKVFVFLGNKTILLCSLTFPPDMTALLKSILFLVQVSHTLHGAVFLLPYIQRVILNFLSLSMENQECYSLQFKRWQFKRTNLLMRYSAWTFSLRIQLCTGGIFIKIWLYFQFVICMYRFLNKNTSWTWFNELYKHLDYIIVLSLHFI